MKLRTSKLEKFTKHPDYSISFIMTVRISDQQLTNFDIQFALDICDETQTKYFPVDSNFQIINITPDYTELSIHVNRFSIDSSIPFDNLTNFSSFLFNCDGETGKISFHIPVYCSPEKKRIIPTDDFDEEEAEEEESEAPIDLKVLLPADPPQ